jgi:hypothetical protein
VVARTVRTSDKSRDPAKIEAVKALNELLTSAGYRVRREELKRGPGWKVVSGSCQAAGVKMIFVDRHMTLDDQLAFLLTKARQLEVPVTADCLAKIPERMRSALNSDAISIAA